MSESIRAVDRALDILVCFSRQTPQLTMTQISERVGLNKSTIHRLLGTLEKKQFLQRDPTSGLYKLGLRMLQMAYLTLEQNDLRRLATPFMHRLCEQTRETVDLSILDGKEVVFLEVVESPQRVKLAAAVGQRLPAYSTASGKAILAFLPEVDVDRILSSGLFQTTPHTLITLQAVKADLDGARVRGFSFTIEEYEIGINAIAAPIFDQEGNPIASIAVAGPTYRMAREHMLEISPMLLSTTSEIGREIQRYGSNELSNRHHT